MDGEHNPITPLQPAVLTFDCFGTLIDWERGLLAALRPILAQHGATSDDEALLEQFAALEASLEAGPYLSYREILRRTLDGLGSQLGFVPTAAEREAFAASVVDWPPFADTATALLELQTRAKLAVITNCDDELFARTARQFPIQFAAVITAAQVRSYKPSARNFERAFERLGVPREQIVHVAQSLYHDIRPARELGVITIWVNRRGNRPGSGATPPATAQPDFEVPDLTSVAKLL